MKFEFELLSDLTMIFVSRDRQDIVLENAQFYESLGAQVVILDGTNAPVDANRLSVVSDKVIYLHSPTSLESRLQKARGLSKTPFTIISSDDDFLVPSGLNRAMEFLRINPSVLSCSGRVVGFEGKSPNLNFFNCYKEFDRKSLQNMHKRKFPRLVNYLFNYSSRYFYAVYRTPDWEEIFTSFEGDNQLSRNFLELIVEFRACFKGPSFTLVDLFWLRNLENAPIRQGEKYRRFPAFVECKDIITHINGPRPRTEKAPFRPSKSEKITIFGMIISLDILNLIRSLLKKLGVYHWRTVGKNREESFRPEKLGVLLQRKSAVGNLSEAINLLS